MIVLAAVSMLLYATACETDPPALRDSDITDDLSEQLSKQDHVTGALNPFKLIENPLYAPANEISYLRDDDMVFLTRASGDVLVFPHRDMGVEVVNVDANGVLMAITYCPITKSGNIWNRVLGIDTLLLTASGYLYKDNMMPLDLNSGNIWSQMLLRRFQGNALDGEIFAFRELSTFPILETTWLTVKTQFPDADVYTSNMSMKSSPADRLDQQLGLIGRDAVELFSMDMFPGEISLHSTTVNPGGIVVVAGSSEFHYMLAFRTTYSMEPVQGKFPVIMMDKTGTMWNIFGEGMMGLHEGETLESPLYYTASDWAWRDLFDNVTTYQP